MIDPISAGVAAAALGLAHSIGPRLVQALIPTPFDKAQVVGIEVQRQRLAAEEARFIQSNADARQRILLDYEQRRGQAEFQKQLDSWPIRPLAVDFIRRSGEARGRAVNVIVRQTDHRNTGPDDAAHAMSQRILRGALHQAERQILKWYTMDTTQDVPSRNGVFFYPGYALYPAGDIQSFATTLAGLVGTEPTLLIDIALCDDLKYRVAISHWGQAYQEGSTLQVLDPIDIDLSAMAHDEEQAHFALTITLSSAIMSMADSFHLLRRPHEFPEPAIFRLMQFGRAKVDLPDYWGTIVEPYRVALGYIAERAPLLASELAAKAALSAQRADQVDHAQHLLTDSLVHFRKAFSVAGDEQAVIDRVSCRPLPICGDSPVVLALKAIRGVSVEERGRTFARQRISIEEASTMMGRETNQ